MANSQPNNFQRQNANGDYRVKTAAGGRQIPVFRLKPR